MARCLLISFLIGETVPLLLMFAYRYVETPWLGEIFYRLSLTLWPLSILLLATGGGDNAADDQMRATSILLNGVLYAIIGLAVWLVFLRKGSSR